MKTPLEQAIHEILDMPLDMTDDRNLKEDKVKNPQTEDYWKGYKQGILDAAGKLYRDLMLSNR
jgi:hypothetical protein